MRRADPATLAYLDGEGAVLPTYADSDVGSSPRSAGVGGGRTGSLTEEPSPAVKWDDTAFTRVKLMCSYGGRILPRPHDNQLRYVGGESRIAVVSRNITFSELTVKLSRMFGTSVAIKYQLPYEDLDALISVTSDEDLENMMEEYDRLQGASSGNRPSASARLRLFLFPSKLERSQTASLSEMMENNHSRERWFVDILNGLPVLPRVRSETSSIVSETPDYFVHGNTDALEEWAAAISYSNSMPPHTGQPDKTQANPVSAAALFGSLVQQAGSNEILSAPGSPSPLKPKPSFTMGSSSSAPPAVMTLLSALVEAASKGPSTPTQHVTSEIDGTMGTFTNNKRLGSGDSVPEQRKHVDSEILLTSDKGILDGSVGGVEQFLPAGLMDDDVELLHKLSAKGSFDEVRENPQNVIVDVGLYQVVSEPPRDVAPESPTLQGQPIFDEEVLPAHMLARNLNVLQLDEKAPSPLTSPSGVSSPVSGQISPQQPISVAMMSKLSADDILNPQAFPVSPLAGAQVGSSEDKLIQQILPSSAPQVTASKADLEDGLSRQGSPSLAHFLPSVIVPQQVVASSNVAGEDTLMRQIPGANIMKDVETTRKVQAPSSATSGSSPAPSILPVLHQPVTQKSPVVPGPNYLFQQSPPQALEGPISTTTFVMQTPGIQLPIMSQTPSPIIGAATTTIAPPIAAPFKPSNVTAAARPGAGITHPQSPLGLVSGGGVFQNPPLHTPQIRTTSPPPSAAPPIMATNVSPTVSQTAVYSSTAEALKGLAPMATNVSPSPSVFSSMGEGIRSIPSTLYQQGEVAHLNRQVSDPLPTTQRMAAISPQLGNQFNAATLNASPSPGVPTRFRAVGRPVQQVVEGVPMPQAPLIGVISDKKIPVPLQRGLLSASARPPLSPATQYSYFMADAAPQSAAMGGTPRYNSPPNMTMGVVTGSPDVLPFSGANPFVDNFQPVSAYHDVLEVPPPDQQQRRQMR